MQVQPYLFFEGRCEEALTFYRQALGAEMSALMYYRDAPPPQAAQGCGGEARLPLGKTFFASSTGVLADRFGVPWTVMAGPAQA